LSLHLNAVQRRQGADAAVLGPGHHVGQAAPAEAGDRQATDVRLGQAAGVADQERDVADLGLGGDN
jgi:hypothetical protein